ncbi:hypothetical protein YC2023_111111 [Brassica napus]
MKGGMERECMLDSQTTPIHAVFRVLYRLSVTYRYDTVSLPPPDSIPILSPPPHLSLSSSPHSRRERKERKARKARSSLGVGARPARERPCRRRSLCFVLLSVSPSLFFAVLSTTALSELWIRHHRLRWSRSWSNDALVGRVLVVEVACMFSGGFFPGGGGFRRSTAAGSSSREGSLH